jgi:hypothetical protein
MRVCSRHHSNIAPNRIPFTHIFQSYVVSQSCPFRAKLSLLAFQVAEPNEVRPVQSWAQPFAKLFVIQTVQRVQLIKTSRYFGSYQFYHLERADEWMPMVRMKRAIIYENFYEYHITS